MLVNKDGKIMVIDEEESEIDTEEFKKNDFNFIKNLKFDGSTFKWYLLTRKNTQDYILYRNILNRKDIKKTYAQIIKNTKKQGNWKMSYNGLLALYISKRFNQLVLKPMCKNALNNNWEAVNKLALLK